MNVPVFSARRERYRKRVEVETVAKTVLALQKTHGELGAEQFAKAFSPATMGGMGGLSGVGGGMSVTQQRPGSSWSQQQALSSPLAAKIQQNLAAGVGAAPAEIEAALAVQGMSWGPPFPPGRPLDPFFGVRRPPRTWDYQVGENVQLTPRWNRVSFQTLKQIHEAYDVSQICVRHLINDVRSLDYNWEPIPGIKVDVSEDIEQAIAFFDAPDKRQPFRLWLAEWLQDVLRYDAGSLYERKNEAGGPIAWEVIDGTTIIPLVDFYGRRPTDEDDSSSELPEGLFEGEITPAFVQIIEGLPWDWLTVDDLTYLPWNPLPESQYGLAPLEAVLLSANTDIRFQWHFLQFFTEGSLPAGFMEAPPDQSDPAQIEHWQETWDAIMLGDQSKLQQIRWVPNGSKFTESKPSASKFDQEFPLYLMRRTCAAYGCTPADLGFTEEVNKATGDTQIDIQFRVGTSPLLRYAEDIINLFCKERLKLRCRIRFDDGKETEDRVATATADGIYLDHGVKGVDEVRQDLGLHVDKSRPMPRYINNTRSGPIPLLALESMAGEIDPETYGPSDSQEPVSTPFAPPPGTIAPQGSPEAMAAAENTAEQARNLVEATTGERPEVSPPKPGEEPADGTPPKGEDESDEDEGGEEGGSEGAGKAVRPKPRPGGGTEALSWQAALALLDEVDAARKAASNLGGPGVTGVSHPTTIEGGIDVSTGIQGVDLLGDDEDEDDEDEDTLKSAYTAVALKRWRSNARNRLSKGRAPRRFVDPNLPDAVHAEVWANLSKAKTRAEVDAAFAKVGEPAAGERPAFHSQADKIVGHYAPLVAKALGGMFSQSRIAAAVKAGYATKAEKGELATGGIVKGGPFVVGEDGPEMIVPPTSPMLAEKAVDGLTGVPGPGAGPPPNLRPSTDSLHRCSTCCLFAHPVCVKYGDWPVRPDQTCDGWALAIDDQVAKGIMTGDYDARKAATDKAKEATVKALGTAEASGKELEALLAELHGDSFLQGAHDAAHAAGGTVVSSLQDVTEQAPAAYWDEWTPGLGEAASAAADGGMRALLEEAGHTIQGLEDTSIDRIGTLVSEGLAKGDSMEATGKAIREVVEDPDRAELISRTEYARSMTAASEQTYAANGIEEEEWMLGPEPCPECQENADASPIKVGDDWPNGGVPVHPNCMCAQAPLVSTEPTTGGE